MTGLRPRHYRFETDAAGLLNRLAVRLGTAPGSDRMVDEWRLRSEAVQSMSGDTPLREVAERFALSNAEYDALLLAVLVEVEPRLCRFLSLLDMPQRRTRPTLGLALTLATDTYSDDVSALDVVRHPVFAAGLLSLEEEGPIPDRTIRVHEDVARRLVAASRSAPAIDGVMVYPPDPAVLARWLGPDEARRRAERCARTSGVPLLVIGAPGSGRLTLVRGVLGACGNTLIAVRDTLGSQLGATARRESRWRHAGLAVEVESEAAVTEAWKLAPYASALGVPFAMLVTPSLAAIARATAPASCIDVAMRLSAPERAQVWRSQLREGELPSTEALRRLANKYRFAPARIRDTIDHARTVAQLERGETTIRDAAELDVACRAVGEAVSHGLVRRLAPTYELADLIAPESTIEELRLASAWLRHGHTVFDDWGLDRGASGLTTLFVGPPGTGKTMAAQVLARELGLDLLRVDISRLLSKYVGETEKNLAALFDHAREASAILFFDEADAVFGKRTETSDAQDRYSNLETAYLLQRLEDHEGVVIMASNMRRNMDEAFARRLQFVIQFPLPSAEHRLRLWHKLLPANLPRESSLDVRSVAEGFEMSGGEIRNAILAAAFLAAEEGAPLGTRHIQRGVARELRKKGAVVDLRKLATLTSLSA